MKKSILSFVVILFFAATSTGFSQFNFSVSPGMHLNGAQFGYKINNKFVPYIGIQYLKGSFTENETDTYWDYDISAPVTETETFEPSGSIFIPTIGLKYYAMQKEKLQAYVNAGFSMPMIKGEVKFDGEVDEYVEEFFENMNFWGAQFGFGTEYFFDTNFSIGGEFGLGLMKGKFENTYEDDYWNPNLGEYVDSEEIIEINGNILPTYTKISLNFYF